MDLQDLIPESDTIEVTIVNPLTKEPMVNEDGSNMTITVWADHSAEYRKVLYKMTDERLAKAMEDGVDKRPSAEELDTNSLRVLAETTKEWNITLGGKKPRLTVDKATEVYLKVKTLRGQVEAAKEKAQAFT